MCAEARRGGARSGGGHPHRTARGEQALGDGPARIASLAEVEGEVVADVLSKCERHQSRIEGHPLRAAGAEAECGGCGGARTRLGGVSSAAGCRTLCADGGACAG